ncbi:MAG: exodeoxyribonuclease VII large subunit [Rickettsiales bacterium]|nr:exodeoxyribonuclease VII large subunit [Rickettsiales bacterium]
MLDPNMIFSVTDAAAMLKGVVETAFPRIRIRGELSGITTAASGHIYMTIKDAGAAISAIIWRGTPVPFKLEEGLEIIATGKFTTYPARSNYQIIVSEMEMAGAGAILKMLEDRKQKLAAEGLFDASRKKPLPRFPQTIGIVTSPTGAAFQDIQNRLHERFPVRVLLYPAQVQGIDAAAQIAAGIKYFNDKKNVDVIIVARGGGSLEDLLPFSEEIVVRAAAASAIPLVSGVGHEPDWMLIDFAADVRAPTPTGAAEIVVPTKLSLISEIENLSHRISNGYMSRIKNLKNIIANLNVKSPLQTINERRQRIDDITARLDILTHNKISKYATAVAHAGQMLESLSYKNTLRRGYAIVRTDNKIISHTADFKTPATIEFADGTATI